MALSGELIFTKGHGVLRPQVDGPDALLDVIASIRDEYAQKRTEALTQMEFHAAQGDARETSAYSTEAERHASALLALNRVLGIAEAFYSAARATQPAA